MKRVYVIYHSNCYDGFGSAWSAYKRILDKATYIPMGYANKWNFDDFEKDSIIFMVDFSAKPDVMDELGKDRTVIVLDHHKTAEENLKGYLPLPCESYDTVEQLCMAGDGPAHGVFVKFDMNKSGAMLTWEFFNPNKEAPRLVKYIQDRDLWKFELVGSQAFSAVLRAYEFDFNIWSQLDYLLEHEGYLNDFISQGELCLKQDEMNTKMVIKRSQLTNLNGVKVAYCNTASHWSEVGHALLEKYPEADLALSFTLLPEYKSLMGSVRSSDERMDASEFVKQFNGGGHRNASGFNLDYREGITLIQDLHDGHVQ